MSAKVTDNSQSSPIGTSNQDRANQISTARGKVVRAAVIATLVIYLINLGLAAGIHLPNNSEATKWNAYWLTVLIGYSGGIFGWLVGFMISPYGAKEEKRLTRVASWISLLFSGYLLGRLEPSIQLIFSGGELIKQQLYGVRALFFLINVVCTGITVYLYRIYGAGRDAIEAQEEHNKFVDPNVGIGSPNQ